MRRPLLIAYTFVLMNWAAVLGLYMLWVSHGQAVQPASTQYPARYRGLGPRRTILVYAALLLLLALGASLHSRSWRAPLRR